jgi:hypothetical protein
MTSNHHAPYVQGYTRVTMGNRQWDAWQRCLANPQTIPQFRSESATRLREVGIASKRGSARRVEYVPGPCTHRPSHHENGSRLKSVS